jgi:hypothetical protein
MESKLANISRVGAALIDTISSTNNRNMVEETDNTFILPEDALLAGDNVITIVQVSSWVRFVMFNHSNGAG